MTTKNTQQQARITNHCRLELFDPEAWIKVTAMSHQMAKDLCRLRMIKGINNPAVNGSLIEGMRVLVPKHLSNIAEVSRLHLLEEEAKETEGCDPETFAKALEVEEAVIRRVIGDAFYYDHGWYCFRPDGSEFRRFYLESSAVIDFMIGEGLVGGSIRTRCTQIDPVTGENTNSRFVAYEVITKSGRIRVINSDAVISVQDPMGGDDWYGIPLGGGWGITRPFIALRGHLEPYPHSHSHTDTIESQAELIRRLKNPAMDQLFDARLSVIETSDLPVSEVWNG